MKRFISRPAEFLAYHLNSWQKLMHDHKILEAARNRTLAMGGIFLLAFTVIGIRLVDVMILQGHSPETDSTITRVEQLLSKRADIIDRNGEILATHLVTGSVYANPKVIINPEEAALKIHKVIPELSYETLLKRLKSERGFIWIVRHISPRLQNEINNLGIPGVYLQRDERRVYPHGNLVSHVLGYCGIDNNGLGGVEQYFDARLRKDPATPLQLSIDMRVQHLVREELAQAIQTFSAEGANCIVMTGEGEILAMVSLPDFDPNLPNQNSIEATFNRNTLGVYECGSTFKIFNTAIALDSGRAKINSIYDASTPIKVGSKSITDFKGKNRPLEVREVFIYSSNIGSAKMALDFGSRIQREYFQKLGLLKTPKLELPEIAAPMLPQQWSEVATMTLSYGYGIAISPIMLVEAVRAVIKGYRKYPATVLKRVDDAALIAPEEHRIVSDKTAAAIRELMRLVVTEGTAKKADIPGYEVIGKTGTAHKNQGKRGYNTDRITSFVGAFPKDNPQYIVAVFLDSPKPTKETYGYATGGWNAAPTAGKIIARLASLMGVQPTENSAISDDYGLIPIRHTLTDSYED
ncbi:peptidoglycan D,D-transpeptidase FtsI family protein [Candidatus Odyssella thessalonicensis]|uniref:peptidoglycan D,D-transpeptidase FtsI family protein n=1 Tax=Candidatus Odyssella thessalonicensis TaxID=84647 RepID=UPI000225BF89|nr:penicillin-binding protein 2 [Candidatus Odyssella thessalonicensis]